MANFLDVNLSKEAAKIMAIPGNVRGEVIKANIHYIRTREGEKGIVLIEDKLKDLGFSIGLARFESLKWYPESLSVLIMIVAKNIFEWQDKDIFDMGNTAPKASFIIQVLVKHFTSLKKTFNEYPNYWRAHFDFGELESFDLSENGKYFIIRIKGYNFHQITCSYYAGFFLRIAQFSIMTQKISIEELQCAQKDNIDFHEYKIIWQ